MHLDVLTLMAMESFVAACAGAVLLVAWSQDRKTSALVLWGLGNIGDAGGILALTLSALGQPIGSIIGGNLLVLAQGFKWKAARTFDGKPAPLVLALLGVAFLGLAGGIPVLRNIIGSLGLATSSIYLLATATTLWLGWKKEPLPARRPVIGFTVVHVTVLLIGTLSTLDGATGQNRIPSLISLFGLAHFETIIFLVGTAVFMLALVKERSEAGSRLAANTDPLTGIANRTAFMAGAERVLARCRHDRAPVAVIMFDLDRFKLVNDTHGHAVGDAVIRQFCDVAAAALRPTDLFGRIGGEEFAVVLPGSSIEAAGIRAERIRVSFSENCRFIDDRQVNATVSGGVSVSANAEHSLSVLLKYSDDALYRAKTEGRNRIKRADQPEPEGGKSTVIRVA